MTRVGRRFDFSFASGLAPELDGNELAPYKIFEPRNRNLKPTFAARIDFAPTALDDNLVGLAVSHSEIAVVPAFGTAPTGAAHFDLTVAGLFVDWSQDSWRILAALYYVDTVLDGPSNQSHHDFVSAYMQTEIEFGKQWHAFARHERFDSTTDVAYLAGFKEIFRRKWLTGIRWDVAREQALSAEIAHVVGLSGSFDEIRLQWSAVFP
jgi:hypothetical protein